MFALSRFLESLDSKGEGLVCLELVLFSIADAPAPTHSLSDCAGAADLPPASCFGAEVQAGLCSPDFFLVADSIGMLLLAGPSAALVYARTLRASTSAFFYWPDNLESALSSSTVPMAMMFRLAASFEASWILDGDLSRF